MKAFEEVILEVEAYPRELHHAWLPMITNKLQLALLLILPRGTT